MRLSRRTVLGCLVVARAGDVGWRVARAVRRQWSASARAAVRSDARIRVLAAAALLLLPLEPAFGAPATGEAAAKALPKAIDVGVVARLPVAKVPCRDLQDPWEVARCVGETIERRESPRVWPKAASGTLRDGWGNDLDMAVLLAALLRLRGHAASDVSVHVSQNPGHACVYLRTTASGKSRALLIDPYLASVGPRVERAWRLEGSDTGASAGAGAGILAIAAGFDPLTAVVSLLAGAAVGEDKGANMARAKVQNVARASRFVLAFNERGVGRGFEAEWPVLAARAEARDAWDPQGAVAAVRNLDTTNEGIVAFGDSLTSYKGGESDYPTHLSRLLAAPVLNQGHAGDTVADAWLRIQAVQALRPRLTIVCLGGNDFMEGVDPGETEQRLVAIVEALQQAGSIVAVIAYEPLFPRAEWSDRYEALMRTHGVYLLPDVWRSVQGRDALTLDMVHPNAVGALMAAQQLAPGIREVLQAAHARAGARSRQGR